MILRLLPTLGLVTSVLILGAGIRENEPVAIAAGAALSALWLVLLILDD